MKVNTTIIGPVIRIGGEFWSDGGYVGTVGDGTTSDVIKNYVQNQGNQDEKEAYKQMKILDF